MHRALELDPLSMILLSDIGQLHYFAREYDQAEDYSLKALAIDPTYIWAHGNLSRIYRQQGKHDAAFEQYVITVCTPCPSDEARVKCLSRQKDTYSRLGWPGYFRRDVAANLQMISRGQVSPMFYRYTTGPSCRGRSG
jgi:Tfp pilus assembly protein PilF